MFSPDYRKKDWKLPQKKLGTKVERVAPFRIGGRDKTKHTGFVSNYRKNCVLPSTTDIRNPGSERRKGKEGGEDQTNKESRKGSLIF